MKFRKITPSLSIGLMSLLLISGCSSNQAQTLSGSMGKAATQIEDSSASLNNSSPQVNGLSNSLSSSVEEQQASQGKTNQEANTSEFSYENSSNSKNQTSDRQIIKTASVSLEVEVEPKGNKKQATSEELNEAGAKAMNNIRSYVNSIPNSYVESFNGGGNDLTITFRIPSETYETVINSLNTMGTVTNKREDTYDATKNLIDNDSKIKNMKKSLERVRDLLDKATDMKEIISLESELSQRETQLDQVLSEQGSLKDKVVLSTITVQVLAKTKLIEEPEPEVEPEVEHSKFMKGLLAGWSFMTALGGTLAVLFGAILPLIPLIAVIILLVIWQVFRLRKIRKANSSESSFSNKETPVEPMATENSFEENSNDEGEGFIFDENSQSTDEGESSEEGNQEAEQSEASEPSLNFKNIKED